MKSKVLLYRILHKKQYNDICLIHRNTMITPEQLPDTFYRVKIKALILNEKKEFLL